MQCMLFAAKARLNSSNAIRRGPRVTKNLPSAPTLKTVKLTLKKTNKATGPSHTFVKLLFMVRWAICFWVAPLCFGTPP